MATSQLRAMSVGEILDAAFTIYRERFGPLIGISIVFLGLSTLLNVYVELAGGVIAHPGLWLVALLVASVGWLPAAAGIVWVISETVLGREPELGASVRLGLRRMGRLFIAGLAMYILVFLGFVALFIPGVIVACGYSVVVQVVVLEDLASPTDALGRSWALTKGYKGKAFGLALALIAIFSVPFIAGGMVAAFVPALETVIGVAAQVLSFVVTPLFACVFTLFYYDLRVRQEGFDLDHLSRELGLAPAARA
jgi:uncharacterized membrane protein